MSHAWMEIAVFVFCAGLTWWFLRSRRQDTREEPFEIPIFGTQDPDIDRRRFSTFERWFRRQVLLSRAPMSWSVVSLLLVCISASVTAAGFVATENLMVSAILGLGALVICVVTVAGVAHWNVKRFREQLPLALDIMAGSVKSGDSLRQAVCLLADTMQEPAKTEFVRCRNQLDMGLSLRATMLSLADRVNTMDTRLFAKTLAVHRETGGQLTSTLQRMAKVIRSRSEYERFMQTTTGMGRMSLLVVVGLAWLIFGYLVLLKPDYGRELWEKPLGQQMLLVAFVLELVGIAWALMLIRSKY